MILQVAEIPRAVTSASNFFRRRLCPGSAREEAKYGPEPDTEYSDEGRLLHSLFYTGERPDTLTVPQREVLDLADSYAREFFDRVIAECEIPDGEVCTVDREVPLQFFWNGEVVMPGHADLILTWPRLGIRAICDAKFGVMQVDDAPNNDQLAIYAVMAWQKWSVASKTYVAIVQPRNFGPRMTTGFYDNLGMSVLAPDIADTFAKSQKKGAVLNAGEKQCHFCRAKVKCEAYIAKFAPLYLSPDRAIETCSNEQLWELKSACSFAHKINDQVSEELRTRISDGRLTDGKLQNSGDERTVKDAAGMYLTFKQFFDGKFDGWSATAFDACRQIVWSKLESFVKAMTGLSDKKVTELVHDLADPHCTIVPKAKRVVRTK